MLELEIEFKINLFDRFIIAYREGGEIKTCNRAEFEERLRSGEITADTIVFNNLISTRKALDTSWEIPMKNSWNAQVVNFDHA